MRLQNCFCSVIILLSHVKGDYIMDRSKVLMLDTQCAGFAFVGFCTVIGYAAVYQDRLA